MLEPAGPDYATSSCSSRCRSARTCPGCASDSSPATARSSPTSSNCATSRRRRCRSRRSGSPSPPTRTSGMSRRTARLYAQKFDLADQILGDRYGYRRPAGGFLLWLDVSAHGSDEAVTLRLWRRRDCGSSRAAIWPATRPTAPIPARLHPRRHGAGPARPPPRRCTALSRCWADGPQFQVPSHFPGHLSAEFQGRKDTGNLLILGLLRFGLPQRVLAARILRSADSRTEGATACGQSNAGSRVSVSFPTRCASSCSRRLRELSGVALICWRWRWRWRWRPGRSRIRRSATPPMRRCATCWACLAPIVADLLMQLFGIAAIAIVLPLAIWGWRLVTHRVLCRERLAADVLGDRRDAGRRLRGLPAAHEPGGRCRPASAASSAMPCCGSRRGLPVATLLGLARVIAVMLTTGVAHADVSHARGRLPIAAAAPSRRKPSSPRKRRPRTPTAMTTRKRAWVSLGWLAHGFLSLKARVVAPDRRPHRRRAPARAAGRRPRAVLSRASTATTLATLARSSKMEMAADEEEDDEADDEPVRPAPRKPKAAPRRVRASPAAISCRRSIFSPCRNRAERTTLSPEALQANATALEGVLERFRRARRDHQCAAGTGGHALRARARARHQIVARDRARRRHRALDERALGARRGGVGPQRHRHRAAESDAREGLSARAARQPRTTTTPPPSCRSASARPSAASR